VRWCKKPIELLFNLEHPDQLAVVTEVSDEGEDEDEDEDSGQPLQNISGVDSRLDLFAERRRCFHLAASLELGIAIAIAVVATVKWFTH